MPPGVNVRSNSQALSERGSNYVTSINNRFERLRGITKCMDDAGVIVSDLEILRGLSEGKMTLDVKTLADLLGIDV